MTKTGEKWNGVAVRAVVVSTFYVKKGLLHTVILENLIDYSEEELLVQKTSDLSFVFNVTVNCIRNIYFADSLYLNLWSLM